MKLESTATRDDMQRRLRRVEGQLRGIQTMLDDLFRLLEATR